MKIQSLLNSKTKITVTSVRLSKLIKDTSTKNFIVEKSIFEKKKKLSDKRIKAFISAKRDSKEGPDLVSIGQGIGGGLGLLGLGRRGGSGGLGRIIGGRPKIPKSPTQLLRMQRGVGGLRSFGRTNVVTNTLLTGLDFRNRKIAGQTNLQAGLGAGGALGGGLLGAAKGAAIGSAILPVGGTLVGGLLGGFLGATAGAGIADSVSGVNSPQFRRKELEKEVQRTTDNTEFTLALNSFDSALLKFRDYDDSIKTIILGGGGRNRDGSRIPGFRPRGGGGATQADINRAYKAGIGVGAAAVPVAIATVAGVIFGGPKLLAIAGGVKGIGKMMLIRQGKKLLRREFEKRFRPDFVKTKKLRLENIARIREANKLIRSLKRETDVIIKGLKERVKKLDPKEGTPEGIENSSISALNVWMRSLIQERTLFAQVFGTKSSQVNQVTALIKRVQRAIDSIIKMRQTRLDNIDLFQKILRDPSTKNIIKNTEEGIKVLKKIKKGGGSIKVNLKDLQNKMKEVDPNAQTRINNSTKRTIGDMKSGRSNTFDGSAETNVNMNTGAFLPQDMFKNNLNMMDAESTYYSA